MTAPDIRLLLEKIAARRGEEVEDLFHEDLSHFLEDFVPNLLLKEETLQKALGVTNREMQELYRVAYVHYQHNHYSLAQEHYRFLVILNPFEPSYWMGYAASLQLLKEYEKALHSYAVCSLLEDENPIYHYHAYECYDLLGEQEEAKTALSIASALCENKVEYLSLQEQIKRVEDKLLVH